MKVILLQDIKNVGKKGQLLNASDGYAKNFLIPKKLAVEATSSNINNLELMKKADEKKKLEEVNQAKELAEKIKESTVKVSVKAGENGRIFGSVTNKEICIALETQTGIKVDKKKIVLNEPFKMTGKRHVDIKLHPQVTAELQIEIVEA